MLAANRRRIAIVFPFFDPYGGMPALTSTIVEGDHIVTKRDIEKRTMCWDFEPVSIRSTTDGGWVVHFRCDADAPVESITLDRDGNER